MKPARRYRPGWDDASFLMRTDPEREKKPRIKSEPLEISLRNEKFDFEACRQAWARVGVIESEDRIKFHMEMLKEWAERFH